MAVNDFFAREQLIRGGVLNKSGFAFEFRLRLWAYPVDPIFSRAVLTESITVINQAEFSHWGRRELESFVVYKNSLKVKLI